MECPWPVLETRFTSTPTIRLDFSRKEALLLDLRKLIVLLIPFRNADNIRFGGNGKAIDFYAGLKLD